MTTDFPHTAAVGSKSKNVYFMYRYLEEYYTIHVEV